MHVLKNEDASCGVHCRCSRSRSSSVSRLILVGEAPIAVGFLPTVAIDQQLLSMAGRLPWVPSGAVRFPLVSDLVLIPTVVGISVVLPNAAWPF